MKEIGNKNYVVDKKSYGVVIDCIESTGFSDCLTNLESLLLDIFKESNGKPKLSTKVAVLKSEISYEEAIPYRYSKEVIKTISSLLKEYNSWNLGNFDAKKVENKNNFELALLEKERERIDGWGPFIYLSKVRNDFKKIEKILKNSKNDRVAKEEIKKEGLSYTYNTFY